jgi:hypothetical protein
MLTITLMRCDFRVEKMKLWKIGDTHEGYKGMTISLLCLYGLQKWQVICYKCFISHIVYKENPLFIFTFTWRKYIRNHREDNGNWMINHKNHFTIHTKHHHFFLFTLYIYLHTTFFYSNLYTTQICKTKILIINLNYATIYGLIVITFFWIEWIFCFFIQKGLKYPQVLIQGDNSSEYLSTETGR